MNFLSRVVWQEGMYLGPHHFQAQSRYFEDSIYFATSTLLPYHAGFLGCEVDKEALQNGTLSLLHARCIFPDGLLLKSPESDALPPPRDMGAVFPPDRDRVTVFLAVPAYHSNGLNCETAPGGRQASRFIAEGRSVADEWNSQEEKQVRVGRKNTALLLEHELGPNSVALPVARVLRAGAGRFALDPVFIPPVLQISASERLMLLLQQLIEILEDKSNALLGMGGSGGAGKTGYSTREIANFWFLHALHAGLAPLRHQFFSKRSHPEELYLELARLAGSLCTFTLEVHPRSIPLYDHDQPDECFDAMDRLIRLLLGTVLPTNCLSIPLTPSGNYLYHGAVVDQRALGDASWVFAIRSDLPVTDLIQKTQQLVKLCSEQFVPELVKRALPGLVLTHLSTPPASISRTAETQYFLVNRQGPCWNHIMETKRVGAYVPGEFPHPEIELLVVLNA